MSYLFASALVDGYRNNVKSVRPVSDIVTCKKVAGRLEHFVLLVGRND